MLDGPAPEGPTLIDAEFRVVEANEKKDANSSGQVNNMSTSTTERETSQETPKENNWLYGEKEDLNKIKSPKLKVLVSQVGKTPKELLTQDGLTRRYEQISDMIVAGEVEEGDAEEYMQKIAKRAIDMGIEKEEAVRAKEAEEKAHRGRLEKLQEDLVAEEKRRADAAEAAKKLEEQAREEAAKRAENEFLFLPESKEQQEPYIKRMLLIVESTDSLLISTDVNFAGGDSAKFAQRIMGWIGEGKIISEELKTEALARIRLQHCAAIMAAIPPDADKAKTYLQGAFSGTEIKKYALRGSDFEYFFKEAHADLPISEAWEVLQEAAVQKIDGIRYLEKGMPSEKKNKLRELMVRKIAGNIQLGPGISDEERLKVAKKSLQLAERIAVATREVSVWNTNLEGSDPLAEAIYFSEYRKDRTKDKGIILTINTIRGFGTSFFRAAKNAEKTGNDKRFISDPSLELSVLSGLETPDRYAKWELHNRAPRGDDGKPDISKLKIISPKDFDYSQLSEDVYMSYLSGHVARVLQVKELFQKSIWKKEDLDNEAVEKIYDLFDTVDPENITKMKSELILGILWSFYCAKDSNLAATLGWDTLALLNLKESLTRSVKQVSSGTKGFLTEEQFEKIVRVLNKKYSTDIYHAARMAKVTGKAADRFIAVASK